ncbi:MAG: zf-HC2 domain-containing protein [Microcoleaceae cyanobacterium]
MDQNQFQSQQYELLSAYLDGEVTPAERRLVEEWMVNDPQFKAMYFQWLQIRSEWRSMPIPKLAIAPQQLSEQIIKQSQRKTQRTVVLSGAALTAVIIAAISAGLPGGSQWGLKQQLSQHRETEPLRIALHEPVIPIVNPEAVSISVDQPLIQIPKAPRSGTLPR